MEEDGERWMTSWIAEYIDSRVQRPPSTRCAPVSHSQRTLRLKHGPLARRSTALACDVSVPSQRELAP